MYFRQGFRDRAVLIIEGDTYRQGNGHLSDGCHEFGQSSLEASRIKFSGPFHTPIGLPPMNILAETAKIYGITSHTSAMNIKITFFERMTNKQQTMDNARFTRADRSIY
jgi:hypothetical protein